MLRKLIFVFVFVLFLFAFKSYAQPCDGTVPSYTVNLKGHADSVWLSPLGSRSGGCCGVNTGPPDNDRCVEFWLTLDPDAEAIRFDIAKGAVPPGALYWKLGCGPSYAVGQDICISGTGPHRITFCKPGNNPNSYTITSIPRPKISPPTTVSDGCTGFLAVYSLNPSTIKWKSFPANPLYDSYLTCTVGCTTTTARYQPGAPPYVDYQVSGIPTNGCSAFPVTLTTRVYFVNNKKVIINPEEPTICFGGTSVMLTANAEGGAPPYKYIWSNGATTQSISVGSTGQYWVHVSDTTSCPQTGDTTIVTAYLSPILANAGPDQTSCANNPKITLQGTVQQAKGGKWSGGTGTYSPSDTVLTAVYTPSAAEIAAGKAKLALTTTGNKSCPAHTDSVLITIKPSPIVKAGPGQSVCANNNKVTLAGTVQNAGGLIWSGGLGGFSPGTTSPNTVYSPATSENTAGKVRLYLTSTTNGTCLPVKDSIDIAITPAPTVQAGPDLNSCQNNPSVNLSSTITVATGVLWSNGTGNYAAGNTAQATGYTPSASEILAGKSTLYVTTTGIGKCLPVIDTVNIVIQKSPVADAGIDQTVCGNNASVTLAGSVIRATGGTWSGGGGTYSSGNTSLTTNYLPSQPEITQGFALLTLTTTGNGLCNAETDQMRITITPVPQVNAGTDFTVCSANPSVVLNGTVSVATGGQWSGGTGNFNPGNSTLNATYTPSQTEITANSATLTLTSTGNGNCLPVTDQVAIVINPTPIVDAGADSKVCANNLVAVLNPVVTGAASVNWTGGTGTFNPGRTTAGGTYNLSATEATATNVALTLTATSDKNCQASDNIAISVTPAPIVSAGQDQTVCANKADVKLNGTVTTATGGIWTGGTGTFTLSETTLNASYLPSAAEILAGKVTLTLTSTGNGNCTPVSDEMIITITPAPTANAGPDTDVCANNSSIGLNGVVTIGSGGTWSGGSGTFAPSASNPITNYIPSAAEVTAGSVLLTLTSTGNGNCLPVSDQAIFKITPSPTVDAGPDATSCANNVNAPVSGVVKVATGGIWSGGSGGFNLSNTSLNAVYTPAPAEVNAGSITLTLTSTGNGKCHAVTDQVVITILPKPIVNAGPDLMLCEVNPAANLSGTVTNAGGGAWTTLGGGAFTAPANLITIYNPSSADMIAKSARLILTSTNNGTCLPVKDTIKVTYSANPTVSAGPDKTVCSNAFPLQLEGSGMLAKWTGGAGKYIPNDSTLNALYIPTQSELTSGVLNLNLATKSNGSCPPVQDNVKITLVNGPVANAGPDQAVCSNRAAVTLNGQVQNAGGGTWSGGNGTFKPDANTLQTVYTPTATEIQTGSVKLILTTVNNGLCTASRDTINIQIKPGPMVEAGPDLTVCANKATVSLNGTVQVATGGLWTTTGKGNFASPSSLVTTYIPSKEDTTARKVKLFLETTGNGTCYPSRDSLTVTITPAPLSNAGASNSFCSNNSAVSLSGSVVRAAGGAWSGGTGGYSPSATSFNPIYTPSFAEINAGFVILTFTTTGNGNCNAVADTVKLTALPSPIVNAGADQVLCEVNPDANLSAVVTNAGGGIWKTLGSGSFLPNNALVTTYKSSPGDITAKSVKVVLTSDLNGKCLPVTDTLVVSYSTNPFVNAGPDKTICSNAFPVQLEGSGMFAKWTGGAGKYIPNDSTLNARYIPTQSELTSGVVSLNLTTKSNGSCPPVQDNVKITLLNGPVSNAGPDQVVCSNRPAVTLNGQVQNAGGGVWSGGNGTYKPDANTLQTVYTPTAAEILTGSVRLILTTVNNGLCLASKDTISIKINSGPVVEAGPDLTVCANKATVSLNGTVQVATGGIWSTAGKGSFASPASLVTTYIPSKEDTAAGKVKLYLETTGNGTCFPSKDSLTVTINPAPISNAGVSNTFCSNNPSVNLSGTVTRAAGGIWSGGTGGYLPSSASLNPVYTPSPAEINAGFVILTFTTTGNGNCNAVGDTVKLTALPFPVVNAGADQVLCEVNPDANLSAVVKNAGGVIWKTLGSGSFLPNNTLVTTYKSSPADITSKSVKLVLTSDLNGKCLPVTDTLVLSFSTNPVVNAGPDKTICSNAFPVQLAGSGLPGKWTGGLGKFTPNDSTQNAQYIPTQTELKNGSITLNLTTKANGSCPAVTDQVIISLLPGPIVSAGPDQEVCSNNPLVSLNASVQNAGGVSWTGGAGTYGTSSTSLVTTYSPTSTEITAGKVNLVLTSTANGLCNAARDTLIVTIKPGPAVDAGIDQTVCANNAITNLKGIVQVATGGIWTTSGSGTFSPNTSLITQYTPSKADTTARLVTLYLTTTGNGTCFPSKDSLKLTITPAPVVDAGPDQDICRNNPLVSLIGKVGVATGGSWSGGAGSYNPGSTIPVTTYSPTPDEILKDSIVLILTSSGNGKCLAVSDKVSIRFTPSPVVHSGSDNVLCINDPDITLNGRVTVASGVKWITTGNGSFSPDEFTPDATYKSSPTDLAGGKVKLVLTSTGNNNCLAVTDTLNIVFAAATSVNAGPDKTVCSDGLPIQLEAFGSKGNWSGGAGSYAPTDSTLDAIYTPTTTEINAGKVTLVLTSKDNGFCPPMKDSVIVMIPPGPVVTAGTDKVLCADSSFIILSGNVDNAGGGVWTTSGTGGFDKDTSMAAKYTFTAADKTTGQISFTLKSTGNGTCKEVSSKILVRFTPAPEITAGPDQVVCANNSQTDAAVEVTVASGVKWTGGSGTFLKSDTLLNTTYAPGQSEIDAGKARLIVVSTGNGDCRPVTDTLLIDITPAPTADAGDPQFVCSVGGVAKLKGKVTIAENGDWSSTGTGNFGPGKNFLDATYTPSQADKDNGIVVLTLITTGNGNCLPVKDSVEISVTPVAVADPGNDTIICSDKAIVFDLKGKIKGAPGGIWATTGAGKIADSTLLNTTYTFSSSEAKDAHITFTLTTNGNDNCNDTSSFVVAVVPAPEADAGQDITVCNDNEPGIELIGQVLNATGGVWKVSGTGTYLEGDSSLTTTYLLGNADRNSTELKVLLTTYGHPVCTAAKDTALILLTPRPIVSAGPDTTLCEDKLSLYLNGTVLNANGGIWKYSGSGALFSATDLDPRYEFDTSDYSTTFVNFVLTTTGNGDCKAYSDTSVVRFTPRVRSDAGIAQTVCANNSEVTLQGNITVATGGKWSGGQGTFSDDTLMTSSYFPSPSEKQASKAVVYLTTTGNGDCKAAGDSVLISITPAPEVEAGNDQILCSAGGIAGLTGNVTVADGGIWSTSGTGNFSPAKTAMQTEYIPSDADKKLDSLYLLLTSTGNGKCLPVKDSLKIGITQVAVADPGKDTVLCSDVATSLQLAGKIKGALSSSWTSDGSGTFSDSLKLDAIYKFSSQDIVKGKVTLTLKTLGNSNCNDTSSIVITILPAPVADAGQDITVCNDNEPGIKLIGGVENATGGIWKVSGTGTYIEGDSSLTSTYILGNSDRDSTELKVILTTYGHPVCTAAVDSARIFLTPRPIVSAGSDTVICEDKLSLMLNGTIENALGGIWKYSGNGALFSPTDLDPKYEFDTSDYSKTFVNFVLTTTGNGDCKAYSDTTVVRLTPRVRSDAGIAQSVCANNSEVLLQGNVSVASGGKWSGGDGNFLNDTLLTTSYIPSASEIQAGKTVVYLTTTGNGDCNAVGDSVLISITPAPEVEAGNDQILCSVGGIAGLTGIVTVADGGIWSSSGTGNFSPANTALQTEYFPSDDDKKLDSLYLLLTSTGNGKCLPVKDSLKVEITTVAVADPGKDTVLCSTDATSIQLAGKIKGAPAGVWNSDGSGKFSDSLKLDAIYTFSSKDIENGKVTLSLATTGNNDCNDTSAIVITILPAPIADAGPDHTICNDNEPGIILTGEVTNALSGIWSSSGSGDFIPVDSLTNSTYYLSESDRSATQLKLVLTTYGHPYCNAATDTAIVNITPRPEVAAGADSILCSDNADFHLNASVTIAKGGIWNHSGNGNLSSDTAMNPVYTFDSTDYKSGFVRFILTSTGNGDCKVYSDTLQLTLSPALTVEAGPQQSVCANNRDVLLAGKVTVASGGKWSGGSGSFVPADTVLKTTYIPTDDEATAGTVKLYLTTTGNGSCRAVSDSVVMLITPAPEIEAGNDQILCSAGGFAELKAVVTVANGAVWTTRGSGSFSPGTGVTDPVYYPSDSDKVASNFNLIVATDGNGNCLPVYDSLAITITKVATAFAGNDTTLCSDIATTLPLSGQITGAPGGVWSTSGTGTFADSTKLNTLYNFTPEDIASGNITIRLSTSGNGNCNDTSTFNIIILPAPVADAGPDQVICNDNDAGVLLDGKIKHAGSGYWKSLTSGELIPSDTVLQARFYVSDTDRDTNAVTLVLTTKDHPFCKATTDSLKIELTPRPTVNAGPDTTICVDNLTFGLEGAITVAAGGTWSHNGAGMLADAKDLRSEYAFDSLDYSNQQVTFVLTSTENGQCKAYSDTMNILFTPGVKVEAGAEQTVCANNSDVKLSGSLAVARGVIWEGGKGTYSTDSTDLEATYKPSSEEKNNGGVTLYLVSTGNGRCKEVKDSLNIVITPAPTVTAVNDIEICTSDPSADISASHTVAGGIKWSTLGTGSFYPDSLSASAEYFYSSADSAKGNVSLVATSTGNDKCLAVTDTVKLTIYPAASIDGGASPVCADSAEIRMDGSVKNTVFSFWKTSGSGGFVPDSADLKAHYEPSVTDISGKVVYFVLSGKGIGTCSDVSDTVEVHIVPLPEVNAGDDYSVCENNVSVNLKGNFRNASGVKWQSSGGGQIAPDDGNVEISYTPTTADFERRKMIFTLTSVNDAACKPQVDTVVVTITDKPFVKAGEDYTICADSSYIELKGLMSVKSGKWKVLNGTGKFSDSTNLNTIYTFAPADYKKDTLKFTLTSDEVGGCISITDNKNVIITPRPTIDAGEDVSICAIANEIFLTGNVKFAEGGQWFTDGQGSVSPTSGGSYRYDLAAADKEKGLVKLVYKSTGNGLCRQVTDSMKIKISKIPVVDAGTTIKTCTDALTFGLSGKTEFSDSFEWYSFGSGQFSSGARASLTQTYQLSDQDRSKPEFYIMLTAFDSLCFPVADSLLVKLEQLPQLNAGTDQIVCRYDTAIVNGPSGFVKYYWFSESGDTLSDSLRAGIYVPASVKGIVEVTDVNGCRNRDTINFNPIDPPKFKLDDRYCLEGSLLLDSKPVDVPSTGSISWKKDGNQVPGNSGNISITETGIYTVEFNYEKCHAVDSAIVTGKPSLGPTIKYVCQDAGTIASTNTVAGGVYSWTLNNTKLASDSNVCEIQGVYTRKDIDVIVSVIDTVGCRDTTIVKIYSVPPPDINMLDIPPCHGELAILNAEPRNIKDRENSKYKWFKDSKQLGSVESKINVDTGYYKVIYTLGECSTSDSAKVDYKPAAVSQMVHQNKFCRELEGSLMVDAGPGIAYKWINTGDSARTTVIADSGFYKVKIYNEYNCYVLDSVFVRLVCPPRLYVPNAIKPGEPGVNGRSIVQGAYFTAFSMTIFNRWGEIIFHTTNPDETWDGMYRGVLMPEGVYPYIINYEGNTEEYKGPFRKDGSITLVK